MKGYRELTYREKFLRTVYMGIPMLLIASVIVFFLASTVWEKILVPLILFVIWLIQLMYTYRKSKQN